MGDMILRRWGSALRAFVGVARYARILGLTSFVGKAFPDERRKARALRGGEAAEPDKRRRREPYDPR